MVAHDAKAGTIVYEDPDGGEQRDHAGHRRPLQAAVEAGLGHALGRARRRLRDGRQGSDRFGQALERDLPRARRRAAGRLQLRAFSRRERPEDLEVERQRPHHRRMAALCDARRACRCSCTTSRRRRSGSISTSSRGGRRVSAVPRSLRAAGPRRSGSAIRSGTSMPARRPRPTSRCRSRCCSSSSAPRMRRTPRRCGASSAATGRA